jgi:hypothetical protein
MEGNGGGIRGVLDQRAQPECPVCGANDWASQEGVEFPELVFRQGLKAGAAEVVVLICGNCGFLRIHSVQVLRGNI